MEEFNTVRLAIPRLSSRYLFFGFDDFKSRGRGICSAEAAKCGLELKLDAQINQTAHQALRATE